MTASLVSQQNKSANDAPEKYSMLQSAQEVRIGVAHPSFCHDAQQPADSY